ncbi:hypothetical protein [Streptomyces phaeolivaceus]|uniref:hypothetical protein n=1 Tax=Streptomyces phaeolivaceus TaxID=2653200 RepID=UPI001D05119A|nr:hypothetical protein [Streptomyces phaeolivaceus]
MPDEVFETGRVFTPRVDRYSHGSRLELDHWACCCTGTWTTATSLTGSLPHFVRVF